MNRAKLLVTSSLAFLSGSLSTYFFTQSRRERRLEVSSQSKSLDTVDSGFDGFGESSQGDINNSILAKYPLPSRGERVCVFENYILAYDRRSRTAKWVFEHLTPQQLTAGPTNGSSPLVNRNNFEFHLDQNEDPLFCATNIDYRGSGFDRGHLAAAGNYQTNPLHCKNTFVLSNISPQVGKGFNRDVWNNLEKYIRAIVRRNRNVYVCTGPLYLPTLNADGRSFVQYQVIGPNNVSVPTHFFKVVVIETPTGQFELLSYVLPNAELPSAVKLDAFLVPLIFIEKSAGFRLFSGLSNSVFSSVNKVESQNMDFT